MTAEQDYQQSVNILGQLLAHSPQDASLQQDLAGAYGYLGDTQRQLDDLASARDSYQQELKLRQQLAQAQAADVPAQAALAYCYVRLGSVAEYADDFAAAGRWFAQGVATLLKLNDAGKLANQPLAQSRLKFAQAQVALCDAAPQAIIDLYFALKQPSYMVADLLAIRGRALRAAAALLTLRRRPTNWLR